MSVLKTTEVFADVIWEYNMLQLHNNVDIIPLGT